MKNQPGRATAGRAARDCPDQPARIVLRALVKVLLKTVVPRLTSPDVAEYQANTWSGGTRSRSPRPAGTCTGALLTNSTQELLL